MEFVSRGHYWLTPSAKKFDVFAEGVYLPEGRHLIIIPIFHYSIIPVVSAANPGSHLSFILSFFS
jgi:hypothetical protein